MALVFNELLNREVGHPQTASIEAPQSTLDIDVIYTSVDATVAALKKAGCLAKSLGAQIKLLVPQVVPFPAPLTSPPVLLEFQERRFREIAEGSPVDIEVDIYLCGDGLETLKRVLKPHSLIFVGGRKRFWPTREKALVRKLARAGHEVIFTETE